MRISDWSSDVCSSDLSAGANMTTANVILSDAAARRIAEIVGVEADKQALRVSVEGGGCSGFSYKFDLDGAPTEDDTVIANGDAKVLIDSLSLVYMEGSEIDFVHYLRSEERRVGKK